MIPAGFEYACPQTAAEALAALADPEAKAIAGGHSLVPLMKLRVVRPSLLVDLAGLGLRGAGGDDAELELGALMTYDELLRLDSGVPDALREAAASVGDLQVRNAGTLGGALAHGDPASDLAAAALALGATLRLRSGSGARTVAAADFFVGPFVTALAQQELLEAIRVPRAVAGEGSAYASIEDPASGYPLAGAAVRVRDGEIRVGMTGLSGRPVAFTLETGGDDEVRETVAALEMTADADDAAYRRQLAAVVVGRALATARARAEQGGRG